MIISILSCLTRQYEYLKSESKYYTSFFWICVALCQVQQESKIYIACVQFLEFIIKTLFEQNKFNEIGLSNYFLSTRNGSLKNLLNQLDEISGLSFTNNFSFAMAGYFLKGFKIPSTKAATIRLFTTILECSCENDFSRVIGYLGVLLPHKGGENNYSPTINQM